MGKNVPRIHPFDSESATRPSDRMHHWRGSVGAIGDWGVLFRVRLKKEGNDYFAIVFPGYSGGVMPIMNGRRLDDDNPPMIAVSNGRVVYMECDMVKKTREVKVGLSTPDPDWGKKIFCFFLAQITSNDKGELVAKEQGFLNETTVSFVSFDENGTPYLSMMPVAGGRMIVITDPLDDL